MGFRQNDQRHSLSKRKIALSSYLPFLPVYGIALGLGMAGVKNPSGFWVSQNWAELWTQIHQPFDLKHFTALNQNFLIKIQTHKRLTKQDYWSFNWHTYMLCLAQVWSLVLLIRHLPQGQYYGTHPVSTRKPQAFNEQ